MYLYVYSNPLLVSYNPTRWYTGGRPAERSIFVLLSNRKQFHSRFRVVFLQGKPADYFVLILEGRVEVTVGRESLMFESGPFTYFGSQALISNIGVGKQ